MKKTLLNSIPNEIPSDIQHFVSSANIYDSSCSPEANVYFIDKGNGYYLKCSDRGMLEKESRMTEYFHSKGFGAEVLHYISDDKDWLLTSAVTGEDCLHERYLTDPKRLCDTMAYELRKLHETDYIGCPVANVYLPIQTDAIKDHLIPPELTSEQISYIDIFACAFYNKIMQFIQNRTMQGTSDILRKDSGSIH